MQSRTTRLFSGDIERVTRVTCSSNVSTCGAAGSQQDIGFGGSWRGSTGTCSFFFDLFMPMPRGVRGRVDAGFWLFGLLGTGEPWSFRIF